VEAIAIVVALFFALVLLHILELWRCGIRDRMERIAISLESIAGTLDKFDEREKFK
jgi:hypothetical protein